MVLDNVRVLLFGSAGVPRKAQGGGLHRDFSANQFPAETIHISNNFCMKD